MQKNKNAKNNSIADTQNQIFHVVSRNDIYLNYFPKDNIANSSLRRNATEIKLEEEDINRIASELALDPDAKYYDDNDIDYQEDFCSELSELLRKNGIKHESMAIVRDDYPQPFQNDPLLNAGLLSFHEAWETLGLRVSSFNAIITEDKPVKCIYNIEKDNKDSRENSANNEAEFKNTLCYLTDSLGQITHKVTMDRPLVNPVYDSNMGSIEEGNDEE